MSFSSRFTHSEVCWRPEAIPGALAIAPESVQPAQDTKASKPQLIVKYMHVEVFPNPRAELVNTSKH